MTDRKTTANSPYIHDSGYPAQAESILDWLLLERLSLFTDTELAVLSAALDPLPPESPVAITDLLTDAEWATSDLRAEVGRALAKRPAAAALREE